MANYVEPSRWNSETKRLSDEDVKSEEKLKKYKDVLRFYPSNSKDSMKSAYDHLANMAEEDIENNRQRIVDQYPKGTKNYYGDVSNNEAGYGKKPKLKYKAGTEDGSNFKKGGKVKASSASKRADGIATKGKTRGRIV